MDDEALTIEHLEGVTCILNGAMELVVGKDSKCNRVRLDQSDKAGYHFWVSEVVDLTADGGFHIRIQSSTGKDFGLATLISKKLFQQKCI